LSEAPPGERDPRLDASGADHPGFAPPAFDLIALENTRQGLSLLGIGLGLFVAALPMQRFAPSGLAAMGSFVHFLGAIAMGLGFLVMAPTPHGPLPRWLSGLYVALSLSTALMAVLSFAIRLGVMDARGLAFTLDRWARLAFLALPWILWRFCQHRGLTGRALVWLWLGMASLLAWLLGSLFDLGWIAWILPLIGVFAAINSWQTARDVWLDAIGRTTTAERRHLAPVAVEPLRPASHGPH
jgi:hypothetical protein